MTRGIYLGVDVGGTKVRAALVDETGAILTSAESATKTDGGTDPDLRISRDTAHRVAQQAVDDGYAILGVGVGVPEYVRDNALHSDLVIKWSMQPAELFSDIAAVTVESDVRCGALAESRIGAGQAFDSLLYVSVGTGISCALVLNDSVWAGHRGEAIALGELPIDRSLDAGGLQTVEEFASGAAIAHRYERLTGSPVEGARDVIYRAQGQDAQAQSIIGSAALAVGSAIAWAVDIADPAIVIVGGGLGSSGGPWLDQVRARYLSLSRPEAPAIKTAALGPDSGVIGAALAAQDSA
ncbi:MAG: ROK family protein [Candidatus Nanopelagicales bacterium]